VFLAGTRFSERRHTHHAGCDEVGHRGFKGTSATLQEGTGGGIPNRRGCFSGAEFAFPLERTKGRRAPACSPTMQHPVKQSKRHTPSGGSNALTLTNEINELARHCTVLSYQNGIVALPAPNGSSGNAHPFQSVDCQRSVVASTRASPRQPRSSSKSPQ
jgi:hypothetical protein